MIGLRLEIGYGGSLAKIIYAITAPTSLLLQETGIDFILLEDGVSFLGLED